MSTQTYLGANPIERMNRRQRRAKMRELGITPAQARAAARRRALAEEAERRALTLTPAQARRALAEWAKRGGIDDAVTDAG